MNRTVFAWFLLAMCAGRRLLTYHFYCSESIDRRSTCMTVTPSAEALALSAACLLYLILQVLKQLCQGVN